MSFIQIKMKPVTREDVLNEDGSIKQKGFAETKGKLTQINLAKVIYYEIDADRQLLNFYLAENSMGEKFGLVIKFDEIENLPAVLNVLDGVNLFLKGIVKR